MPLDPVQVENYTNKFLGYGNPNAGWWFIGSEEGGGNSMEEVEARVGVWQESGALPFERVKSMVL